jgi:hypothetical protein
VRRFIQEVDLSVYEKYRSKEKNQYIEKLRKGDSLISKRKGGINTHARRLGGPKYIFSPSRKTFVQANTVEEAVDYCRRRCISESVMDKLLFCPRDDVAFGRMIIFPFHYDAEAIYGFQGRSIESKRFYTFMPNNDYKVYNFFGVDKSANVPVFESIIDSFTLPNSIAMLGADLSKAVKSELEKPVFVFDNDRTGQEKTLKYLKAGERCFIWPRNLKTKDFNEIVMKHKLPPSKLRSFFLDNIYEGLRGELEIQIRLAKSKKTFRRK